MHNTSFNHHFFKNHLKQVQGTIHHLHRLVGTQMHQLTAALKRKGGGTSKPGKTAQLQEDDIILENQIIKSLLRQAGSFAGDTVSSQGSGNFRVSQRQAMSDAAAALSRAMQRNL